MHLEYVCFVIIVLSYDPSNAHQQGVGTKPVRYQEEIWWTPLAACYVDRQAQDTVHL